MHSLTYYLTIAVLKGKGIKRIFSETPIDYKKLRKGDIHNPKKKYFKQTKANPFSVKKTIITEIIPKHKSTGFLILFCHGGAFVSGPSKHHWDSLTHIVKETNTTAWMLDYPKAPEYKITDQLKNIESIFDKSLEKYDASKIIVIGDSAGGTLLFSLLQQLVKAKRKQPITFIGISPIMDASMTNPEIESIDKTDPMLSKNGVLSAKKMCAGEINLKDPILSPLYGEFTGLTETVLFLGENDISFPDQKLAVEKMKKENVPLRVIVGKGMPHIWPLLPVMIESKVALKQIIKHINTTVHISS